MKAWLAPFANPLVRVTGSHQYRFEMQIDAATATRRCYMSVKQFASSPESHWYQVGPLLKVRLVVQKNTNLRYMYYAILNMVSILECRDFPRKGQRGQPNDRCFTKLSCVCPPPVTLPRRGRKNNVGRYAMQRNLQPTGDSTSAHRSDHSCFVCC